MFETLRLVLQYHHQQILAWLLGLGSMLILVLAALTWSTGFDWVAIDGARRQIAEYQIDINSASWQEFVVVGGIGETQAKSIVEYREQHGPFQSHESLLDVPGIGKSRLLALKRYLLPIPDP